MTARQRIAVMVALLSVTVTTPIWLFLLYKVLARIGASVDMWVAFWVYVPVTLIVAVLVGLYRMDEER